MTPGLPASTLLQTIAEPTRLRILNCLAGAPLFVSDLQAILELPQPTVSRHLTILRHTELVRDTPVGQYVLYRLRRPGRHERLLSIILESLTTDEQFRYERQRAQDRSRSRARATATRATA